MNESIVQVEHLSHRYSRAWAVRDISFEIRQTGILGLLGSNGAGKSTTMNIMCGVLNQTEGRVLINGIDLRKHPESAKRLIGFLPQSAPLHFDLTVDEYLRHCANLRHIPYRQIPAAMGMAKERCGLGHFSKRLIKNLSGGYRQRVGIAQAIIHKPTLVVLDEPTNGLDPNQITEVRKLIREIAEDRAIVFSSHILSEIQATCQRIIMIEGGRIVFSGTMNEFNNYMEPSSMLVTLEELPAEAELLEVEGITRVEKLTDKSLRLSFNKPHEITERFIRTSVQRGWRLKEVNLERSSLDEIFAQLSQKNNS